MAKAQILGGRIYDALIGLTGAEHGATLVTLDHRAALVSTRSAYRPELADS